MYASWLNHGKITELLMGKYVFVMHVSSGNMEFKSIKRT